MKVSIIGATGYTGAELLRLLAGHEQSEVIYITSESYTDSFIGDVYPHLDKIYRKKLVSLDNLEQIAKESDVLFIGLPHGHAVDICQKVKHTGVKIIDLGSDYRFHDISVYEKWYKTEHKDKETKAVYGLCELYRDKIKSAQILANPGCYVTASILAIVPLLKEKLIETKSIIVDAKSGVSGAGRSLALGSHFSEVFDSFRPYGVASHRHTPEIEQVYSDFAGEDIAISFTPHLLPIDRGILATCYANLKQGVDKTAVDNAFTKMYADEYFVRLLSQGNLPAVKQVRGSNFVDIAWQIDERTGRIIVMSVLDNLVKGASGQAIQNMNIMFDLPENMGLKQLPLYP